MSKEISDNATWDLSLNMNNNNSKISLFIQKLNDWKQDYISVSRSTEGL